MKKFTESIQHFNRELIDELASDFAEEMMIQYKTYISIETLFDQHEYVMWEISEVDTEMFQEKHQLFLTCEFSKMKKLYRIDEEGLRVHTENFDHFKKLIDELDTFLGTLESKIEYEVNFNVDKMLTIHFEKDVEWRDYYEIFISLLQDYINVGTLGDGQNTCEVKNISNAWVLEFDIESEIKALDDRMSDPLHRYFMPQQEEIPSKYEEYMKDPMTLEKWENLSDREKHTEWLDRFNHRVYSGIDFEEMKTINSYKFQLWRPTDPHLDNYLPN
jgi:hypothetical protein